MSFRFEMEEPGKAVYQESRNGYLPFKLVTFLTPLTFVLSCHLIISDFRLKSCVGRRRWGLSSQRQFSSARSQLFLPDRI
jgi:hypothetical protein